jgi:hypothetical protein
MDENVLNNLSQEQQRAVMMRAQMEANEQVMQAMMEKMTKSCFEKCAGTSVRPFVELPPHVLLSDWPFLLGAVVM